MRNKLRNRSVRWKLHRQNGEKIALYYIETVETLLYIGSINVQLHAFFAKKQCQNVSVNKL